LKGKSTHNFGRFVAERIPEQYRIVNSVVAIAALQGTTVIYSDDPHLKNLAGSRFQVIGVAELSLPPREA
jgi:hypothetical protein